MIDSLLDFFQRNWVLSILVLIVFGYLLGLSITSTVEYRLRDAVIQMPTPKQTIIVHMNSKKTNEFFEGGTKSTSDESSATSTDELETKKSGKPKKSTNDSSNRPSSSKNILGGTIKIVDKIEDHPVYENFISSKNRLLDNTNDEFISAASYTPSSYKDIPDTTQKAYALSYKIAESLSKTDFPFKAFNYDVAQQQFTKFTNKTIKKE